MEQTFEATLVRQCAPTLAGIKPGSLFCRTADSLETTREKVRVWDEKLRPLGLAVEILLERPETTSTIVYVYRPSHLERILTYSGCRSFLSSVGYQLLDMASMLGQLSCRLRTQPDFPHEIGIFLGYPLRDVIGFIENRGKNFTCCGFWKSYSNPVSIQKCFDCYRRCIDTYVQQYEQGIPIEVLTVSA